MKNLPCHTQPSKFIIVEDESLRIRFMLEAITNMSSIREEFRLAALKIIEQCGGLDNFDLARYCVDRSSSIIILHPNDDRDLSRIENELNACSTAPTICFLDLALTSDENSELDNIAESKLPRDLASRPRKNIMTGVYIREFFGKKFGRLIILMSVARFLHYSEYNHKDDLYCRQLDALWPRNAELAGELISAALIEYRDMYRLHDVQEISEFLWFFYSRFKDWATKPIFPRPFSHKSLEGTGECFLAIERFLLDDGFNSIGKVGESLKGLFWIDGDVKTTRDCRGVTQDALFFTLKRLGIQATFSSDPDVLWSFPFKPALALLFSLRNFIFRCSCEGNSQLGILPEVIFSGSVEINDSENSLECFRGSIILNFEGVEGGCRELLKKFASVSKGNSSRPRNDGSISQALYDLLRAQIDIIHCDCPELGVFSTSPIEQVNLARPEESARWEAPLDYSSDGIKIVMRWEIERYALGDRAVKDVASLGFDHAKTEFKKALTRARITEVQDLADLVNADIAIAHPSSDHEDEWRDLIHKSAAGSIRIRTSSQGRSGQPHRITAHGVIELQLQPTHYHLDEIELRGIIEEMKKPGAARSIASGKVPSHMAKYFQIYKPAQTLSALAIFCQGYLAMSTGEEGNTADVVEEDYQAVTVALEYMKWLDVLKSSEAKGILSKPLRTDGSGDRNPLRDHIQSTSFWKPLVTSLETSADDVKREWDSLTGLKPDGASPDWNHVKELLDLLQKKGTPGDRVGTVARAYLELAARLGGA